MKKIVSLIIIIIILFAGFYVYKNKDTLFEKKNTSTKKTNKKSEIPDGIFKDYYEKAQDKVNDMSLEEKVGQLFLVRYE